MQAVVRPSYITGSITPPASKSMMQRACAGALLHNGKTIIRNPGNSEDDLAALSIIQDLGARVTKQADGSLEIVSDGKVHAALSINCGESGLSARMFAPIAALSDQQVIITGSGSLSQRPMNMLHDILLALGVNLPGFNSYLPVTVQGPIQPRNIQIDGSLSSQYLTGVLFALTAVATKPVTIEVSELNSKPYVDLTLDVLGQFGKMVVHEDYKVFHIDPSSFIHKDEVTINIETDWSSAAFWLTGAAINGNVSVNNLNLNSTQADKAILEVLRLAGAEITTKEEKIAVSSTSGLKAFHFDTTQSPDLFPALAILATYCEGESEINGLNRLTHKESDRTESITAMLKQFGVSYRVEIDSLFIKGQQSIRATAIDSYKDHRITMAAAIGALRADGPVIIDNANAVAKSYPDFFKHLASLGAHVALKA